MPNPSAPGMPSGITPEITPEITPAITPEITPDSSPDSQHLYVTWEDYHRTIEALAVQIYRSGWEFNQIVCLAKGGLRIGDILCRIYDVPLAILAAASYGGDQNQERGNLVFGQNLTMTTATLGDRILVVDDLVDSGITLRETLTWLRDHYDGQGSKIAEIRTAVLWYKAVSVFKPDYYAQFLEHSPWIHQPFEVYERQSPAELAQAYCS